MVLEHTVDGGTTWTPVALGDDVRALWGMRATTDGLSLLEAVGDGCEATERTSVDDGVTWKAAAAGASGAGITPDGVRLGTTTVANPCPEPLDAFQGTRTAIVVCDGQVEWRTGTAAWVDVPLGGVRGVAVDGNSYTLARVGASACEGVQVETMTAIGVTPATPTTPVGCNPAPTTGRSRSTGRGSPCGCGRATRSRCPRTAARRGEPGHAVTAERVRPTAAPAGTQEWSRTYSRRVLVTDLLALVWVVFGVQIAWLGLSSNLATNTADLRLSYFAISVVVIVVWMAALALYDTRGARVIGTGSAEYRLVADSSVRVFGLLAIAAFLLHVDLARGYVLIAFPVGILVLLLSRWMWRQWLVAERKHGGYSARVLLVGSTASVLHIGRELARAPEAGYRVVGAAVSNGTRGVLDGSTIESFGGIDDVASALQLTGADTVVITSSDDLPPERVRQLSWSLEPGRQHLVVAPSLTDIGGPRIHTRPVQGLPLIHVETPTYSGRKLYTKRAFDLVGSAALLLVLSPVLLVLALLVKTSSPGPVFFRQERVGLNGSTFRMIKFRSMVVDAEARLQELSTLDRAEGNAVLFKMKNDPRVTRIGAFMRRYSLDEVPQLFNVFVGDMSLVGPRPPLAREVERYDSHVHRRFLVKPGMTGLWQVSGRSDLSWEDSVRLDLFYVENWSTIGDVVIMWKTFRAVTNPEGAY